MEIYYRNSNNETMVLTQYPVRLKQKTAGIYSYEWEVDATELGTGSRVNAFEKKAKEYEMTVDFSGARGSRAELLQEFYELVDYDVIHKSPGRLYVGEQYVEGYVIASESQNYEDRYRTVGKICTFYVPYPFWMEEKTYSFPIQDKETESDFLDFPYDFPYDFTIQGTGLVLQNEHYIESGFRMIIYGPCVNPYVTIGGHLYRVNTTVDSREYLVIETKNNLVYRVKNTGERVNEFNNREKSESVFEKIPPGQQTVSWPGTFGWDITLYNERSEPKWS